MREMSGVPGKDGPYIAGHHAAHCVDKTSACCEGLFGLRRPEGPANTRIFEGYA